MFRLSSPITALRPRYDAVVVGSGYGGAIAAARLARQGRAVCLLERGRELLPGEYPDTEPLGLREVQLDSPLGAAGSPTGLFDLRLGEDMHVLVGCGLGGTSLINAGVMLEPDRRVFNDPCWPTAFRNDPNLLAPYYARVRAMLRPEPLPEAAPLPAKLHALRHAAAGGAGVFYRTPIAVNFEGGFNAAGVEQGACSKCGDCCSGCNTGAKTTTLMTYLPDAAAHGAEIFTRARVIHVEPADPGWRVHFEVLDPRRNRFDPPPSFVEADVVILSAGTLGTSEILLRSALRGLAVSSQLGRRFSGNGDALGFAYNTHATISGAGASTHPPESAGFPGPCITGVIDRRAVDDLEAGYVVQDAVVPGALASSLPLLFAAGAGGGGADPGFAGLATRLEAVLAGPYKGPVGRTATLLVMGHDEAKGELTLEDGKLRLRWPGAGTDACYARADAAMRQVAEALGGSYVQDPVSSQLLGHRVITVHPLGGCAMADDAERGVVNHMGQVFAGQAGVAAHNGLYVWDGSIIPRSLGVNPLLTISALAERASALLAAERGWTEDTAIQRRRNPVALPRPGLEFTERMRGWLVPGAEVGADASPDTYRAALEPDGNVDPRATSFAFVLTVVSDDLVAMLQSPQHEASIHGSIEAPFLSDKPLRVTEGKFRLFIADPNDPAARRMEYNLVFRSDAGVNYALHGFKSLRHGSIARLWPESTTLFFTVKRLDTADAQVSTGVLHIEPADFLRQISTIEVTNTASEAERLRYLAQFGRFFSGTLFTLYGGVASGSDEVDAATEIRKRRPLRAPAPEPHALTTPDGTQLLLTRYKAGSKGPVILAHAFGVNTLSFSTDTVETNLVEFLCARQFDVWLFDYRASPLLSAAGTDFSIDDIAHQDWPAAVDYVRRFAGVADVQVIAHCVGSMSFLMAMLAGMKGVRSAICSQLTLHPVSWWMNHIKASIHLARGLRDVGVRSVDVNWHRSLLTGTLDLLLRLNPIPHGESCSNPVCRRIFGLFGPSYKHAQLNAATHAAIHEMFGVVGATAFEHLSLILDKGHVVDRGGNEIYMPHLDRLAFPIFFIAGADNKEFYPETSERTYRALCDRNGTIHYRRKVFANYAHMDFFIGKNAAVDIFPALAAYLESVAPEEAAPSLPA